MQALGLVETRGLVGAVEGADAMLKAADVRLLEKSLAGGGLVTITVAGGVSAVQASVDAACAAIERIPGTSLVSAHVIPRPDDQLHNILKLDPEPEPAPGKPGGKAPAGEAPKETPKEAPKDAPKDAPKAAPAKSATRSEARPAPRARIARAATTPSGDVSPAPAKPAPARAGAHAEDELKAMSLGNLRALARRENIDMNGKGLARGLAQASKKALIQAILKAQEGRG